MCDFITAVLPKKARVAELTPIFARYQRALEPLENASIRQQLEPGESYFSTTMPGGCDCESFLGSAETATDSNSEVKLEREVAKKRQQGWGPAKIEKWLLQRATSEDHRSARGRKRDSDWAGLLEAVLGSGAAPYVGLLIHEYHGPLSEEIRLGSRERVRIAVATQEFLAAMRKDVLYEFRG